MKSKSNAFALGFVCVCVCVSVPTLRAVINYDIMYYYLVSISVVAGLAY